MPDNDDLRMNQNETLNCKLALMGVWTEACREAAAYFGVNPDGSGNFSSVTQAQAGSTAGTLAVDGISADEMTSRLAASLVEHFPDKTDIITGDPAAAKAYVKQYVVDLANHQALAQARTNSKLFHKQLNRAAVGLADEHGPYAPVPAAEEEFDMCVPLMDGTIEENSEEVAEFSRELDRTGIRYKFSELAAAGSAKVQTCLEFMSRDIKAVQAACTRAAQNISARGRAFADKVKCVPFVLSAAAQGISDAVRDAAEIMGKGYEEIKAAAAKDPRSVAAAAKHCAGILALPLSASASIEAIPSPYKIDVPIVHGGTLTHDMARNLLVSTEHYYRDSALCGLLDNWNGLAVAQRALLVQAAKSMREDSPDEAFASLSRAIALIRATDERAGDVSDHTLAHNLLISGFEEMERDNTKLISRQISEGRLDIGEIARAFVGAMGRKTGAALDAALEGKHAGCYSRDVDALVFTDDDIDDYANMIEHGRPDLDFIQCREIASQAVTDWNDGHAMDGFTEFLYDYADEHAPAESVKQGGGIRH